MLRIIVGIFFILHGLVYLLYAGHSSGMFELAPGLTWPAGSWAFSRLLGDGTTKILASAVCILAALGFAVGGAGLLFKQAWWQPAVVATAGLISVFLILLWDGGWQRLPDKGGVGLLINLAILVTLLVFHWPRFDV